MNAIAELIKVLGPKIIAVILAAYVAIGAFVYFQTDPGKPMKLFLFEFTKAGNGQKTTPGEIRIKKPDVANDAPNDSQGQECRGAITTTAIEEAQHLDPKSTPDINQDALFLCEKYNEKAKTLGSKVLYARALASSSKDRVQAKAIFEEAARAENAHSHLVLGFVKSQSEKPRPVEIITHFLKGFIGGEPYGAYGLGLYFEVGVHDIPDYVQAAAMYQLVAEILPEAQFKLGQFYQFGLGVEKNKQEALRMLQRAAASGNSQAIQVLEGLENAQ